MDCENHSKVFSCVYPLHRAYINTYTSIHMAEAPMLTLPLAVHPYVKYVKYDGGGLCSSLYIYIYCICTYNRKYRESVPNSTTVNTLRRIRVFSVCVCVFFMWGVTATQRAKAAQNTRCYRPAVALGNAPYARRTKSELVCKTARSGFGQSPSLHLSPAQRDHHVSVELSKILHISSCREGHGGVHFKIWNIIMLLIDIKWKYSKF